MCKCQNIEYVMNKDGGYYEYITPYKKVNERMCVREW